MQPDLDFYSTAAQVIPVLLLAFALDVGHKHHNYPSADTRNWLILGNFFLGVVVLSLGEVAALKVLDAGRASDTDHALVIYAMGIGGYLLLLELLWSRITTSPLWPEHSTRLQNTSSGILALAVGLAVLTVFAF